MVGKRKRNQERDRQETETMEDDILCHVRKHLLPPSEEIRSSWFAAAGRSVDNSNNRDCPNWLQWVKPSDLIKWFECVNESDLVTLVSVLVTDLKVDVGTDFRGLILGFLDIHTKEFMKTYRRWADDTIGFYFIFQNGFEIEFAYERRWKTTTTTKTTSSKRNLSSISIYSSLYFEYQLQRGNESLGEEPIPVPVLNVLSRFPQVKILGLGLDDEYYSLAFGYEDLLKLKGLDMQLEYLNLLVDDVDYDDLVYFFCDILPHLPKLSEFMIGCMIIADNHLEHLNEVVTKIHNRIKEQSWTAFPNRLRKFGWYQFLNGRYNMIGDGTVTAIETEAVRTLFRTFPELEAFDSFNNTSSLMVDSPNNIWDQINQNRAGRILLERGKDASEFAIPLSVWPTVLRRAGRIPVEYQFGCYHSISRNTDFFVDNPDGIYYLLRNEPILQEKRPRSDPLNQYTRSKPRRSARLLGKPH